MEMVEGVEEEGEEEDDDDQQEGTHLRQPLDDVNGTVAEVRNIIMGSAKIQVNRNL